MKNESVMDEIIPAWYSIWWRALTRPTLASYKKIVREPGSVHGRVIIWLLVSSWLGGASGLARFFIQEEVDTGLICYSWLLSGFAAVLGVVLFAWVSGWIAQRLGGEYHPDQLAFGQAAFISPMLLVHGLARLLELKYGFLVDLADRKSVV